MNGEYPLDLPATEQGVANAAHVRSKFLSVTERQGVSPVPAKLWGMSKSAVAFSQALVPRAGCGSWTSVLDQL